MENSKKIITSNFSMSSIPTITALWILDGFNSLSRNTSLKTSPLFPSSEANNKWYVQFNAQYECNSFDAYIDLSPADTFDQKSVTVSGIFSVLNYSNNKPVLCKEFDAHTFTKPFRAFSSYFAEDIELRNHVVNNKLKIRCVINLPSNYLGKPLYENDLSSYHHFIHDFLSMYNCHDFSDFVIEVDDEEIAVHKNVLAARSPVFKAMLKNDVLEAKEGFVKITDFRKNTISALLKYMYTIKVDIESNEDAKALLLAADYYGLLDLKQVCESYLLNNCNVDNFFDLLVFADEHDVVDLKNGLLDYIAKNRLSLKDLASFKLSDSRQTLWKDLISAVLRK